MESILTGKKRYSLGIVTSAILSESHELSLALEHSGGSINTIDFNSDESKIIGLAILGYIEKDLNE
jgi:hypothetical protein|tara:strand:- start:2651 stop:2848 length:198 start_codon:yes stop_codon:yes gene_type:complete